jgi:hypothetical protein
MQPGWKCTRHSPHASTFSFRIEASQAEKAKKATRKVKRMSLRSETDVDLDLCLSSNTIESLCGKRKTTKGSASSRPEELFQASGCSQGCRGEQYSDDSEMEVIELIISF